MPKKDEELCAINVLRYVWKILKNAKDLEEAKKQFRESITPLILGEEPNE
jgi:hypothetical protein